MTYPTASADYSSAPTDDGTVNILRILVSGASGMIGSRLCVHLGNAGHDVRKLVRHPPGLAGDEIQWDPATGSLHADELAGFDVFVHLSGENIAGGRWTQAVKNRIRDSRVKSTRLLADAISRLQPAPRALIAVSAIGYYGDQGDDILTEDSPSGRGFLSEVCREWEAASEPARAAGVRVVNLRAGVVLSPKGGALAKMLGPFGMGLGGVIGSGRQWISWIALSDLMGVFEFVMRSDLSGVVNAVSPQPVTNREFTKTLGSVLHRPTIVPISATMLRLTLGKMAEETILSSARVLPARLTAAGFTFDYPQLEDALLHELNMDQP